MFPTVAPIRAMHSEGAFERLHPQKRESTPIMNNAMQTILALCSTPAARDADTATHSQRLVPWAIATAQALHCTRQEIKCIALGTLAA